MERSIEIRFFLPIVRYDAQRTVCLFFERHAPFGSDTYAVSQLGIHVYQPVGFVPVRHGLQVRFDILHPDTFPLHIRPVDFRGVQRLETLFFCIGLKSLGGIDTVVFQNFRSEVDRDKFVQYILRHNENAGMGGILSLLQKFLEEGFER